MSNNLTLKFTRTHSHTIVLSYYAFIPNKLKASRNCKCSTRTRRRHKSCRLKHTRPINLMHNFECWMNAAWCIFNIYCINALCLSKSSFAAWSRIFLWLFLRRLRFFFCSFADQLHLTDFRAKHKLNSNKITDRDFNFNFAIDGFIYQ